MEAAHLATANDSVAFGANSRLYRINVNTKAASAVVTVYNGTSTSDPVVAVIDAATASIPLNYGGARFPAGLFVKLTGGNADVTVVAG